MKFNYLLSILFLVTLLGILPNHLSGQERMAIAYTYDISGQLTLENAQQMYYTNFIYDISGNLSRKYSYSYISSVEQVEHARGELVIYPNPAEQIVNISSSAASIRATTYTVFSVDGRPLITGYYYPNEMLQVDVSELLAGFYLLQIGSGQNSQRGSFVKL